MHKAATKTVDGKSFLHCATSMHTINIVCVSIRCQEEREIRTSVQKGSARVQSASSHPGLLMSRLVVRRRRERGRVPRARRLPRRGRRGRCRIVRETARRHRGRSGDGSDRTKAVSPMSETPPPITMRRGASRVIACVRANATAARARSRIAERVGVAARARPRRPWPR